SHESAQTVSLDLPPEAVGDELAIPDSVPQPTLPALLDTQDKLSILQRYPNFFVLSAPSADHQGVPDTMDRMKEQHANGKVDLEEQILSIAPPVPAPPKSLFGILLGRLRDRQLEAPAEAVETPLVSIYV